MILYALFAVVIAITLELYHRTTSRPAGVFSAASHQETTAGHRAAGPDVIRRATSPIQPRNSLTLTFAHFIRSAAYMGILTRHKGIYNHSITSGKTGKPTPGNRKRTARLGSAQKIISISRHQIPLFWHQKPFGCVSIFQKLKIFKILDRGDSTEGIF